MFHSWGNREHGRDCSDQEVGEPRVCLHAGCPSLLAAATDFNCSKAIAPAKAAFNPSAELEPLLILKQILLIL